MNACTYLRPFLLCHAPCVIDFDINFCRNLIAFALFNAPENNRDDFLRKNMKITQKQSETVINDLIIILVMNVCNLS